MHHAQIHYQGLADARHIPAPGFEVGTSVYVKAKYFCSTRPSRKLSEKNLGPFEIIARMGTHSITLCLPESMRAIHPVFHVSQIEPAIPNVIPNCNQPPPPLIVIDRQPEFEIGEILDSKIDRRRRGCNLLYTMCWLGYEGTDEEYSSLLAMELDHAPDLVAAFHARYPHKPGPEY
jgi:hypothetical protein